MEPDHPTAKVELAPVTNVVRLDVKFQGTEHEVKPGRERDSCEYKKDVRAVFERMVAEQKKLYDQRNFWIVLSSVLLMMVLTLVFGAG